jgi:ParB-like chromosome segregation protein Spo0J
MSTPTGLHIAEISSLNVAPWNPRTLSEAQRSALKRSLEHFGAVDPAIVRHSDGLIVGGHQRVMVASEDLEWTTFPVVYVEGPDEEMKALNIALNKIAGAWDTDKLGELLAELRASDDVDASLTGFDDSEIDRLLKSLESVPPEEFPETQTEFVHTCPSCGYRWS